MGVSRAVSRILAILIVLAMLASAFAGYGLIRLNTGTHTTFVTETHTVLTTVTDTVVRTNASCAITYPNGVNGGFIEIPSINSTAQVCLKYYYYNLKSTITVNTSLLAVRYQDQFGSFENDQNFTITSWPYSITIGGPNNENEGVVVVYSITPISGGNGTFLGNIGSVFWMSSGHTEVEPCGYQFTITVGNGMPNYLPSFDSCLTLTTVDIYSPPQLWIEIVGLSNGMNNA